MEGVSEMKTFIITVHDDESTIESVRSVLYLGTRKAEECPGFDISIPLIETISQVTNAPGRMTFHQREKLWHLCAGYNVPFREEDYSAAPIGFGSYSNEPPMYEGWIGGLTMRNKTLYVGVEPNGRSHS